MQLSRTRRCLQPSGHVGLKKSLSRPGFVRSLSDHVQHFDAHGLLLKADLESKSTASFPPCHFHGMFFLLKHTVS